jgi:hypothetical protein
MENLHSFLGPLKPDQNTKEACVYRFLLVAALVLPLLLLVPSAAAQADQRCFPETNQCISARIRAFWEQNGGLPVFGFPTIPQHEEVVAGKPYQVQWFERNRMELHPENQPPYDVLLGRLGVDRLQQQGRDWFTFPKADPSAPHYFAQTGHAIAPQFWSYWSSHGLEFDRRRGTSFAESLALFGMPLSEPAMETNSGGATVLTQWFERARFELHPENAPPYDVLLGLLGNEVAGGAAPAPAPQPRPIDNQYFPLKPGTTFIYDGTSDGHAQHDEVVVTHETKVIQGVPCVVVHDTVTQDGQVIEATIDWYAQDQDGNVWYYGEDVKEYENGALVSTEGTWEAGVNGAQAGIIMKAHPQVGDAYYQENAANVAEDQAQVLNLNGSITVPYGSYTNALVTKEWTRLDPSVVDEVSYAPGVGLIQDVVVQGGQEEIKLVSIKTE